MRTRALVLAVGIALAGAAPSTLNAAAVPSSLVSDPATDAGRPVLSAGPDGSASIAFRQNGQITVAVKRPGQEFGTPTPIGTGTNPTLATAANGRTVLAWIDGGVPRFALREPGAATFTPGEPIADTGVGTIATAAAPDGRIYLATARADGATLRSVAPSATDAASATSIATTVQPTSITVTHQTGGDIGWLLLTVKEGQRSGVFARRWSAAVGAGPAMTVDATFDRPAGGQPLNYGENYNVFAASAVAGVHPSFFWRRSTTPGTPGPVNITVQTRRSDEPFSPVPAEVGSFVSVSTAGALHLPVTTALANDGAATAVWGSTQVQAGASKVSAAVRSASGSWGATVNLDSLVNVITRPALDSLAVTSTGGGASRVAYTVTGRALAARLSPEAQPLDADPIVLDDTPGSSFEGAVIAGTNAGDTAAAWIRRDAAGVGRVIVALDDTTPPALAVARPARPAVDTLATSQAQFDALRASTRRVTFQASATDLWTPTTLTWDFGDGTTATGDAVEHQFAPDASAANVTVTARDLAGNATTQRISEAFPTVVLATQAKVSGVKLSRKTFQAQRKKTSSKRGSVLTFSLSDAAKVEISVSQSMRGYKKGKACVSKKPKGKRTPKRCTSVRQVGLVGAPSLKAGPQKISLDGKVAGKTLKPGKYTLTVASIAPLQTHGTGGVQTTFTIKK